VGGGAPVSVQSMTTTLTADVNATLQQIAALTATGCQIVRVAVPLLRAGDRVNHAPGHRGDRPYWRRLQF
jgi:4-hydroxy-3-methylbut-2-en-1-yl diphosphate synthase IspG/GcpE